MSAMGATMESLELFTSWRVSTLRMEAPQLGTYVVRETRDGRFDAELLMPGGAHECVGEGYETMLAAVAACEDDLGTRTGGGL